MNITTFIPILSALIIAIGWYVTAYLNWQKDVAAKRLKYRLEALKSFLPVWFEIQKNRSPFQNPNFLSLLETARSNIQLYGLPDEIENMESFISSVKAEELKQANDHLSVFVPMIRTRIRKELGIE